MSHSISPDKIIDAVHMMGAEIEALCKDVETERRLPDELIEKLKATGAYNMPLPASVGGNGATGLEILKSIAAISEYDSAAGWCSMIYMVSGSVVPSMPEGFDERVKAIEHVPLFGGATIPSGRAKRVEGGVEVTGRWAWGSGTHHCDFISGGFMIAEGDDIMRAEDGSPIALLGFFDKSQVKLHDNWNPSGLRGTGSVDFEVTDAFVPEGHWFQMGNAQIRDDGPLFQFPFFGFFSCGVASVLVGIATRALRDFLELTQKKVPAWRNKSLSETSMTQAEIGMISAKIEGAKHHLYGAFEEVWNVVEAGADVTLDHRRKLRLAATHAALLSKEAVDMCYDAGGGTSIQDYSPLQRHFRDIHAATQHIMVSKEPLQMAGAALLFGESHMTLRL